MAEHEGMETRERGDEAKQLEFQLQGRHLSLLVLGLALFGLVLFLLGRWTERVARPAGPGEPGIEEATVGDAKGAPDAAAPRELTFYETLGKQRTPGFHASAKTASRGEPPAMLPEAARGDRFRVQVASTRDLVSARRLVDRLLKKGYSATIETTRGPDGRPQYKVRIGNYSDRAPAEKMAARIRSEEKVDAWIVRVEG